MTTLSDDEKAQACADAFKPLADAAEKLKPRDYGGYAFPVPQDAYDIGECGMSLREYLAAHAPDMPVWFNMPYEPQPSRPSIIDGDHLSNPRIREACLAWRRSSQRDNVPAHDLALAGETEAEKKFLRDYQAQFEAYAEACEDRRIRHDRKRYFAWRWHYADAMIAARKAGQP